MGNGMRNLAARVGLGVAGVLLVWFMYAAQPAKMPAEIGRQILEQTQDCRDTGRLTCEYSVGGSQANER